MPPAPGEKLASISGSNGVFEAFTLEPNRTAGKIRWNPKPVFDSPPYGFEADFVIGGP